MMGEELAMVASGLKHGVVMLRGRGSFWVRLGGRWRGVE